MVVSYFHFSKIVLLFTAFGMLPVPASFAQVQTILPEPEPEPQFFTSRFPFSFLLRSDTTATEPTIIPMCMSQVSGFIPLQSFGATTCPAQYLGVILITNPSNTAVVFSGRY